VNAVHVFVGAAALLLLGACPAATWDGLDDTTSDGGSGPPFSGHEGGRDGASTPQWTLDSGLAGTIDASWAPSDACAGDPACQPCMGFGDCTGAYFYCVPAAGQSSTGPHYCSDCPGPGMPCPGPGPYELCDYGRCVATCDEASGILCPQNAPHCVGNLCLECMTTDDCGPGSSCTETHRCVECQHDKDCSGHRSHCNLGSCVECLGDGDCDDGGVCNSHTNECYPPPPSPPGSP